MGFGSLRQAAVVESCLFVCLGFFNCSVLVPFNP